MVVYGRYNLIVWSYMVEKGIEFIIEEGDRDILKGVNFDFIVFNYYCIGIVGESKIDDIELLI